MSTLPQTFVVITPRELKFDNVQLNQPYTQRINLENTLSYPVKIEIKAGNELRYTLSEHTLTLPSHQSKSIDIELKLTKAISAKALKIKDIFYIKSEFFNDHITASIIMSNPNEHTNHSHITDIDCSSSSEILYDSVTPNTSTLHKSNKENHKLREYIRSLENNVSELTIQLDYLSTVKGQINASIPDLETIVDATIGQERALNEVRNKKVLQILQTKDEEIETLKQMSHNYQAMDASLHVLQKKHVHLTQKYTELQTDNNHLNTTTQHHRQQITKLNDKIASYAQQSQFQKKVVHDRDVRIKELTTDIQQTQKMLTKSTETMKHSYNQQIKELQSKLAQSTKSIQRITNELKAKETQYKNELLSFTQIKEDNRGLKAYKDKQQATFEKELNHIQKDATNTVCGGVDREKQINYLQIELAKLRAFVRLGLFSDNQNIIDYQKGKNINKDMMNELARKSAHLSASQAIIQQQRDRISELEKLQKMTNHSVFEQSVKLNESNKKLTNNSAENQRLLTIHKRQIEILNKKLSASIKREEQSNIKWKNLKQKLNASESDYVDKIEELEQALQAINTMHQKSKRKSSKSSRVSDNQKLIEMVELENKLMQTETELTTVRKRLKHEMTQRKMDIKAHDTKLQNRKQMYEKQIHRMQSIMNEMKSNDVNVQRVMQLNHELGQSETLRNELMSELQIVKAQMETLQQEPQDDAPCSSSIDVKYQNTMNTKRDELLLAMNDKCLKQKEEIEELENMMNAAISELKKYNPDIVDKLKHSKQSTHNTSIPVVHIPTDEQDVGAKDQIATIKQICDDEINRYQQLYQTIDDEYQSYKKKINQDIQQKDESYLNELAQQRSQITKLQSEIADLRKSNLHEQEASQTLRIANQSLSVKLEQYSELQSQSNDHTDSSITGLLPSNDSISASKMNESDIKRMEEIITHQEAQIQVLMSTIETLQHHKPKKSQIVELSGRLAVHETLEAQRKKELEMMRSKWQQEQENKAVLEKQCGNIRTKFKSLKFELQNTKQQNESIRNRFEHYQRQIIDKENKIHELELTQSRLQSIRKQLESRANIMQNELDNLSKQHFQHLQSLSNEHQNQLKKWTKLYGNNTPNKRDTVANDTASMNHSLQTNVAHDFHDSLKSLSHLLEKYLIHEQQLFDDEKRKLGLTSIEYTSLMNSFKDHKKGKNGLSMKSKRKTLETIHTIQDKHQFMKQLMNIVNEQYGNILSLQKQAQFYEWLSRHHYTKRRESETSVLSMQCELQVNKKHLTRVKSDMEHTHLIIQQQIQQRKDLMKEQMNKSIHRYLALETKCNTMRSQLQGNKKQCKQFESKYYITLNQLNTKSIDLEEKEAKLKQTIADEWSINANGRDKKLKEYLHDHLKKIIEETVRRYQKNDLYENQIFELSNEILSLRYVQNELTQQLEKALFDHEDDKNQNQRLQQMIKTSSAYYDKMKQQNDVKSNDSSQMNSMNNSVCVSPKSEHKTMRSIQDVSTMELEQDLCDKKLENESLHNTIHGLQKEIEELLEKTNIRKIKHEDELKNMREQIGQEREILIQNHHHEMANHHQQHQQKIQKLQSEMEQVSKRVRPWTDSLDLNQLKQTVESQSHELSRANIHLQTLRTKITQLEYELSDNQKEMESQTFVIDHLQDTIKLFSVNNEDKCTNMIVSVLCKELVKARRCQSNAMIKLRVASQSEIELQETISSREKRINELKKHLSMNRGSSGQGQVMDIMKKDRKLDEMILELASKDAEIRYLKKKLAIEQTKITVVYDIQPLQELVDKIDVYYHHQHGTKIPCKPVHKTSGDMETLHHQIHDLMAENKRLKECQIKYISSATTNNIKHDRLEISQCKNKLNYLVQELNGYISKVKSVCTVSLSKSSQRTTLKLKKMEDLCKLQHIKITACGDQINQLLMNVISSVDVFNEQYDGLQVAHQRLQQHIAEEKTKYVEMEQDMGDIRVTLETYKSAEKTRNRIQTITHHTQTDDIPIDFETRSKIISLQNTIKSLRKSKDLEAQDWREDVVSLHEQLLQSKIDVNRYQHECQELQSMYMELKAQLQTNHTCDHPIHPAPDHRLQLQAIELKRKIASLQRQLNDTTHQWKETETKYQKLLTQNMDLKQKSERLKANTKQLHGDNQQRFTELESICDTLQHELKDTKSEYQKQSLQFKKIKDKTHKLKAKNDALTQQTLTTERRSDEESSKLREQLISAQSENKKIRDLVEELQHQIIENESNMSKIKCDKDADIEITTQTHRSKIRDLREKYDKDSKYKNEQIKQHKELYQEEQEHHTQHFNELMQEFDDYKSTQTRIKKMYEIQLSALKKRFENAIVGEQERLSFVNDAHSVHSNSTTSLRRAKSPHSVRSRNANKSHSISRICVSDYSSLLYDLSQRDAAIKSLKSELKSLKLTLKKKERECQKIINRNKDKNRNANPRASSSPLRSPKKQDKTNSLFEIRASAVWSARLAHCSIQITELKKKLEFEQQMTIQKEEDVENYRFETKQLKLRICNLNKKLEHQMSIKSKKNQTLECERQNWKAKEKEWEQQKDKWNQNITQCKTTIKRLRDDIHRKEDIMRQIKEDNAKMKDKMKSIKLKSKSMSFVHSDQYKELNRDIECMRNKVNLKESLLADLKRKHERLQSQFDKNQLQNHELHSKHRTAHSEISRKDVLINELKHKLETVERENIENKTQRELINKLKLKCKQLKNNENRKDELWRSNKQRLESVMKELNALKAQNEQKQSKIMNKLNKIQSDEQSMSRKYEHVRNESVELKTVMDRLYHKFAVINDDLMATLNDLQNNYYKERTAQTKHKKKKKMMKVQSDDTLEAARIVDGFSVNELEEIMRCKEEKKQCVTLNRLNTPKKIIWDKYEEKRCVVQLFEKLISERIRLEMMIHKMKTHQNRNGNFDNDQFEKIKIKHQKHLNEYQSMLKKFRKHK